MIKSTFNNIEISALATAVSIRRTLSEEFDMNIDSNNVKLFKKSVGVEGRYDAAERQTASDFAYVAVKAVMEHKK